MNDREQRRLDKEDRYKGLLRMVEYRLECAQNATTTQTRDFWLKRAQDAISDFASAEIWREI